MIVRDVPLQASRTLGAATPRFNMVGLHWRGAGAVYFEARTLDGRWSAWGRRTPTTAFRAAGTSAV